LGRKWNSINSSLHHIPQGPSKTAGAPCLALLLVLKLKRLQQRQPHHTSTHSSSSSSSSSHQSKGGTLVDSLLLMVQMVGLISRVRTAVSQQEAPHTKC
jgi:hypothetical protein